MDSFTVGLTDKPFSDISGKLKKIDGIGTYTYQLYQHLKDKIAVERIYLKNFLQKAPVTDPPVHWPQTHYPSYWPQRLYRPLHQKIDLLHVTNYTVPHIKKTPIVWTVHDAIMLKHRQLQHMGWLKWFRRTRRLKQRMRYANHVITISEAMRDDIAYYWQIAPEKISVIYHGIDEIWFKPIADPQRQAVLAQYNLKKPFFLVVGTLQFRKNIHGILAAYRLLAQHIQQSYDLVIVGQYQKNLTSTTLLNDIRRLQQNGHVHWLQYIDFNHLRSLYQSAEALVFPSLEEGFGFPILEGFASHTPVITSHSSAPAEIAGDAAYLVDPYDIEHIKQAMQDMVEQPEQASTLVKAGLQRVRHFSWETCAEKTIQVYQGVLS